MNPGRNLALRRRSLTSGLILGAVLALALSLASAAGARGFPSPSCGWAKPSLVDRTFGLTVNARKPRWQVSIAPVLNCSYVERQPRLQFPGQPIVSIQFREVQRLKLTPGFLPVKGLGSCRVRVSCPIGQHQAAWIYASDTAFSGSPTGVFTSGVLLSVEDGVNLLNLEVLNPNGALPVAHEQSAVIGLARKLLPRFRYK